MSAKVRKTLAAEAIATYFCDDIDEVVENAYQPTLLFNPTVFTCGDDYYCAMKGARKPKTTDRDGRERGFIWKPVFDWQGYTVYCSKMDEMND